MVKEQINITNPLDIEGFIRQPQVLQILSISKTSLWRGVKAGRFPKPVRLGPRTVAWRIEDIRKLIDSFSEGANNEK